MSAAPKTRPKYYDVNIAHLPPPGLVSIFHRVTGVAMVLFLTPLLLYLLQQSLTSEATWREVRTWFSHPLVKLVAIGFLWSFVHHFIAGIRFLLLDVHIGIEKEKARSSARWVLIAGVVVTLLIGGLAW